MTTRTCRKCRNQWRASRRGEHCPDCQNIARNILYYRDRRGLSIAALAAEIRENGHRITASQIRRYENDLATPRYRTLQQIAEALGCGANDLLNS